MADVPPERNRRHFPNLVRQGGSCPGTSAESLVASQRTDGLGRRVDADVSGLLFRLIRMTLTGRIYWRVPSSLDSTSDPEPRRHSERRRILVGSHERPCPKELSLRIRTSVPALTARTILLSNLLAPGAVSRNLDRARAAESVRTQKGSAHPQFVGTFD